MPYKSDRMIRSERSLLVQVRVSGVEADSQLVRTNAVRNNGKYELSTAVSGLTTVCGDFCF